MININSFLLKELFFSDGNWAGKMEFIIDINGVKCVGTAPFTYYNKFYVLGLTYPNFISNQQRKQIRKLVIAQSKTFLESVKKDIIDVRENSSFKPKIEHFFIDDKSSFDNNIVINFKLEESNIEFIAYIFLFEGKWNYEIKPKTQYKNLDFIRYLNWEYDTFIALFEKLKKDNSYRMKVILYPISKKKGKL